MNNLQKIGIVAIIACLLGAIADVLLLYTPLGNYEANNYHFFYNISYNRLVIGHYIGILIIPFELAGFWQVYKTFVNVTKKQGVFFLIASLYALILGVVYHGMLGQLGTFMHLKNESIFIDNYTFTNTFTKLKFFLEPISAIMLLLFAMVCGLLFFYIQKQKTLLPKWVNFFNPLILYLCIIILYALFPAVFAGLLVAGFNAALAIFFGSTTFALKKIKNT